MTHLSLDIRAERRAKRRNKKVLERNPLLADEILEGSLQHWLTTPAAEKQRLIEITDWSNELFARLARSARRNDRKAAELRALVSRHVSPEQLAAWDRQRTAYPKDPVYAVEHWWGHLRRLDPPAAHRRCRNRAYHEHYREFYDRCPCCHKPIARILPPVKAEQVKLEI